MVSILAIAPYEGLDELITQIANQHEDAQIDVLKGDLLNGVHQMLLATQRKSYDVIISRGGTADLIRQATSIPVIEIKTSTYDILRCIKMSENYNGKVAIAGFPGITENAEALCDILQIKMPVIKFRKQSEVYGALERLKNDSVSLVISDNIGVQTAHQVGMNAILITAGVESVKEAVNSAINLASVKADETTYLEIMKFMMNKDGYTVLIYNETGKLLYTSGDTDVDQDISNFYNRIIAGATESKKEKYYQRKTKDSVLDIKVNYYSRNGGQYIAVRVDKKPILIKSKPDVITMYNLEDLTATSKDGGSANIVGEIFKSIEKYAESSSPVIITGEIGTGKNKAASMIYEYSELNNHPFFTIDCHQIDENNIKELIDNENSPLWDNGVTIHFIDVGSLSEKMLHQLCDYMLDTRMMRRNRVIFTLSALDPRKTAIQNYLAMNLSCLILNLAPLRERQSDIPGIAAIYINKFNTERGKQIIGFTDKAIECLKRYDWPGNLIEFKRFIEEVCVLSDSQYIDDLLVEKVLKQERGQQTFLNGALPGFATLNLERPLNEISVDIAHIVLEMEGMNKDRTAQHLGISRSTLWRMLKN